MYVCFFKYSTSSLFGWADQIICPTHFFAHAAGDRLRSDTHIYFFGKLIIRLSRPILQKTTGSLRNYNGDGNKEYLEKLFHLVHVLLSCIVWQKNVPQCVANVQHDPFFILTNDIYCHSTNASFRHIRSREHSKYDNVIHCCVMVSPVYNRTESTVFDERTWFWQWCQPEKGLLSSQSSLICLCILPYQIKDI